MNSSQHYEDAVSFRQVLEDRLRKRALGNETVPKCNKHCPPLSVIPPRAFLSNAPEPFSVRRGVLLRGALGEGENPSCFYTLPPCWGFFHIQELQDWSAGLASCMIPCAPLYIIIE